MFLSVGSTQTFLKHFCGIVFIFELTVEGEQHMTADEKEEDADIKETVSRCADRFLYVCFLIEP